MKNFLQKNNLSVSQTETPKSESFKEAKEIKDDFESTYPCFYCGYKIYNYAELLKHKIKCHKPEVTLRDNHQRRQPKLLPQSMPSSLIITLFPIPTFKSKGSEKSL